MGTANVPWGRFEHHMAALVKIGLSQETPPLPEQTDGALRNCCSTTGQPLPFLQPGFAPMPSPMVGMPPLGAPGVPMTAPPLRPMAQVPTAVPPPTPAPVYTEAQRQQMERLAQLPPTELEKLPAATKMQLLEYLQKSPKPNSRVKMEVK
eukprot:g10099.t1